MNYRQAELLATLDITTAGTKTIDIDVKDVISRLVIILELINNGSTPTNHPLAAIKTIEVVDGSEVIASMSGYAAQAMSYYDSGVMPHNELNYEDNAYCRATLPLNFGRFLFDDELALDPTKFRNLQLRIVHDYSLGGSSPDGAYLRVLADMFDEKVASPRGFLLNKEVFSYIPASGSAKYVDLPLDNMIRKLLVINTNDAEEPDIQFETLKLDEEDGKRIIYDAKTMDFIRNVSMMYGQFQEYLSDYLAATTATTLYLSACKDIQVGLMAFTAATTLHATWSGGRARVFQATAADFVGGIVSGRCPHGAVPIFLGKQADPDDWWDVSRVGKARLIVTPRADPAIDTAKTTDIIVQSLHSY